MSKSATRCGGGTLWFSLETKFDPRFALNNAISELGTDFLSHVYECVV